MKLQLFPTVIFRTPKFSTQDQLIDCWESLKESIAPSSPEFFEIIKDMDFKQLQSADFKVRSTVWKYFNRAKFRATPYGSFAGVGTTKLSFEQGNKFTIESEQTIHEFKDWSLKDQIAIDFDQIKREEILIFANSSFYIVHDEIRYISKNSNGFEITSIGYHQDVLFILEQCKKPISYPELYDKLIHASLDISTIDDLIYEMLDSQLLLTSMQPNIIGEEYFKRIGKPAQASDKKYLITERKTSEGNLDQRLFKQLPELTTLLHQLMPPGKPNDLTQFIERFTNKFEQSEIPLMMAIDPEIGVGYTDLEQAEQDGDNVINALLKNSIQKETGPTLDHKEHLLRQIIKNGGENRVLDLNDFPLSENTKEPLPNTSSIICSCHNDQLYLDYIGGATANLLAGRFTLAIPEIEAYCKQIVQVETEANPDVLFFDIGYTNETNVDNVNRRKSIYPLQLNILNYDTSAQPLLMTDLTVCVKGGKLILRSKSLNKRMVPRVASAYNYRRSDLSLFRLLCDLQHQDTHSNLMLKAKNIFPGLHYYPRIQFKNIIVSPESWLLTMEQYKKFAKEKKNGGSLADYLLTLKTTPYVKTGTADQTICFQLSISEDVAVLMSMLEKEKQLWLEEAPKPERSLVSDSDGRPFNCQLMVNLFHHELILKPFGPIILSNTNSKLQRVIPPGKDWLYFEIFCKPFRADLVLLEHITPYLKINRKAIKTWFFIRYSDGGEHLRLRLELNPNANSYELISQLSECLSDDINSGLVSDLRLRTYKREVYRYGYDNILNVEQHFGVDSDYVRSLLGRNLNEMLKYWLCISLLENICNDGTITKDNFNFMVKRMLESFTIEHQLNTNDFKTLNNSYKDFCKLISPNLNKKSSPQLSLLVSSFSKVVAGCRQELKNVILSDLFHMHVNRMFNNNQRTHEMVIYYFLQKRLTSNQHQQKLERSNDAMMT